jgi:hypothetical protein
VVDDERCGAGPKEAVVSISLDWHHVCVARLCVLIGLLFAPFSVRAQQAGDALPPDSLGSGTVRAIAEPSTARTVLAMLPTPIAVAAGGQLIQTPTKWPRTWSGYRNRLGDQFGFLIVEESVRHGVAALVPWTPHTAPCLAPGEAGFGRQVTSRVRCSWRTTTTLQSRDGGTRPNLPMLVALVTATATSLAWRPERANAVKARSFVAQRLAISFGATLAVNAVFPPAPH